MRQFLKELLELCKNHNIEIGIYRGDLGAYNNKTEEFIESIEMNIKENKYHCRYYKNVRDQHWEFYHHDG